MGLGDSVVLESISMREAPRRSLDGFQNTIGNYVLRHDTMVQVETVAAVLAEVMVQRINSQYAEKCISTTVRCNARMPQNIASITV